MDYRKVRAFDKNKYSQYLIDKQIKASLNKPPEIAVQIVKALLLQSKRSKDAVIKSKQFDKFCEKFKDFVLSEKYDKIEALSDYALGIYNPKLKADKDWYSEGRYYKI